jgi:hypothetical protein
MECIQIRDDDPPQRITLPCNSRIRNWWVWKLAGSGKPLEGIKVTQVSLLDMNNLYLVTGSTTDDLHDIYRNCHDTMYVTSMMIV